MELLEKPPVVESFKDILRNLKAHCRVHKSPTPALNLNQINPVHTTPSYTSSILILFTAYVLIFLVVSSLLALPPPFLFSPIRAICPVHLTVLDQITLITLGEEYKF
jgi:hypothetical protein